MIERVNLNAKKQRQVGLINQPKILLALVIIFFGAIGLRLFWEEISYTILISANQRLIF